MQQHECNDGEFFYQHTNNYDVEYKRSREHGNADGLSRLPLPPQLDQEENREVFRVSLVDALPVTAAEIASETTKDPVLSQVYHYVMEGWPRQGVSEVMRPLHQIKDAFYGE